MLIIGKFFKVKFHTKYFLNSRRLIHIQENMGASAIPIILMTLLWGVVGVVLPVILPKGPNRSLLQCILIITAISCWLFWLCCYMHQMNPLIGPFMHNTTLRAIREIWE